MKNFALLNVTPAFVKPNCAPRASVKAQHVLGASKAFDGSDEKRTEGREAALDQAKRGREQGEAAAVKRSADTERTAGRSLVTGLSSLGFTLPCPPSANKYWRTTKRGKTYVSQKAREYKTAVARLLRGATPTAEAVSVKVHIYRPEKRGDLDNYLKVLFDALSGFLYLDDSQVAHLEAWKLDDKDNPRAEVSVSVTP